MTSIRLLLPEDRKRTAASGKRRSKIDLQFVANTGSGFHRFSWEAKRLGPGHAIAAYLGPAGLGCFLSGQYSSDCEFGGMIGYAQAGTCETWHQIIHDRLENLIENLATTIYPDVPVKVIRSNHDRKSIGRSIKIFHTVLKFN